MTAGRPGARGAGIDVRTTERGLPVAIRFERNALSIASHHLAETILSLCQLSAKRAQVLRRRELVARGFAPNVLQTLNLSTEDELVRAEEQFIVQGKQSRGARR